MSQSFATQIRGDDNLLTTNGYRFDTSASCFGELRESNDLLEDRAALRQRMAEDGYLFLRGYLDREQVLAVRREFVAKLGSIGLIDRRYPLMEARYSGDKTRLAAMDPGVRGEFTKDLNSGPALRALCFQGRLMSFYEHFLGGAVRPLDKVLVRNARPGAATAVHFDWVYFTEGTRNLYTTWIPIGDIALNEGPLAVLEGSHKIEELRQTYGQTDALRDTYSNKDHPYFEGILTKDAPALQKRFGTRWLTTEFRAGDTLIFGMYTLHCSLDNNSPQNRIRLSVDMRYQLDADPVDERWMDQEDRFGPGMD